jgi:hypothetical protein
MEDMEMEEIAFDTILDDKMLVFEDDEPVNIIIS